MNRLDKCFAIIVAGGSGRRFGGDLPKQFVNLGGKPVVLHSLETFAASPLVESIVLVVPEEFLGFCREVMADLPKLAEIVPGGETRRQSVYNGLCVLPVLDEGKIVLVHDGARPFVTQNDIKAVAKGASCHGAATLAIPVTDTIKQVDDRKFMRVKATLRREGLFMAQTPQGFRKNILMQAHEAANPNAPTETDDCQLVEKMGIMPKILAGSGRNIKITLDVDLALAEILLKKPPKGSD